MLGLKVKIKSFSNRSDTFRNEHLCHKEHKTGLRILIAQTAHVPARLQAVWAEVGQLDCSSYQNSETSFVLLVA